MTTSTEQIRNSINGYLLAISQLYSSQDLSLDEENRCYLLSEEGFSIILQYDAVSNEVVLCCYISKPIPQAESDFYQKLLEWNHAGLVTSIGALGLCTESQKVTLCMRMHTAALDEYTLQNYIQHFISTAKVAAEHIESTLNQEEIVKPPYDTRHLPGQIRV